jgi:D-serine deaminase-like pyridoxal phosphate-dependent protein
VTFLDLAAFDNNVSIFKEFAVRNDYAIRPALKSFHNARFIAYALRRLGEPRGLIFHLRTVDEVMASAPSGTDLMMGYPPAFDEVAHYLRTRPPRGQRPHRVRILVDSIELLEHVARLARRSRRPLPLEIALQLESGFYLSGFRDAGELRPAVELLRRERKRLRLTAVVCYDGHASFRGERAFRERIAEEAQRRLDRWMAQLADEAGDLYDASELVVNGPGSSTYALWDGDPHLTEISPGAGLLFHGYITGDGYENAGLLPTLHHASPVHRKGTGTPLVGVGQPTAPGKEEVSCKGGAWPTSSGTVSDVVFPEGLEADDLSGGRGNNQAHFLAPEGTLDRGDYVVFRPRHAGDAVDYFGALLAVRGGRVVRVWDSFSQPGSARFLRRLPRAR